MNSYHRERVDCIIRRCKQRAELVGFEAKNELLEIAKDLEKFLQDCDTLPAPGPLASSVPPQSDDQFRPAPG